MKSLSNPLFVVVAAAAFLFSSPVLADDDDTGGELAVVEAETAPDIEDREAVDATDSFSVGDEVNVWMAVQNPDDETTLDVVWKHDGEEVHTFEVTVGTSPRWRTWARLDATRTGDWSIDINDSNGDTLETVAFSVSE